MVINPLEAIVMKQGSIMFIFVFLSFFVSFRGFPQSIKKDYHRSFDVHEGMVLRLQHGDGDVTVRPWDQDMVDVTVHYRAESRGRGIGSPRDFEVEFRKSDDIIYIIGKERGGHGIWIGFRSWRRYVYTYTIQAPDYMVLDFSGEDGNVRIKNWANNISCNVDDGDVELQHIVAEKVALRTEDGSIEIGDLHGNLTIRTDDGDIYLRDSAVPTCRIRGEDGRVNIRDSVGDFEIDVDDGDVELRRVRADDLDLHAVDGDMRLNLLKPNHPLWRLETDDGDIVLNMEAGTSASFSVLTEDGHIRVHIPDLVNYRERRHQKSGEFNGGNGRIRIRTVDGNVTLREEE